MRKQIPLAPRGEWSQREWPLFHLGNHKGPPYPRTPLKTVIEACSCLALTAIDA